MNEPNAFPSTRDARWEKQFAKLVAFKARFGHCNVHCHWPEDPAFGNWVSGQRQLRKRGLLKPERIRRLEELGFIWQLMYWKNGSTRPRRMLSWTISPELEALNLLWKKRLAALRKTYELS